MFYDVVIELNAELEISAFGHELARYFGCQHPQQMAGACFQDLLHVPEERELFLERMARPINEQESMADVIHVFLRLDGMP
eukprot:CAMPEP_0172824552 /NCGR_PEP_ID=MMETSP1075-20121228/18087_1 /TAXON_ID=2916 /ORGANISM="Ceratium fusus, Strain PA161109" /LENGTH=80 /DNA_ID=CAMNT_0013665855 /DNA_START=44 /DNA_END=283 /DNA_ORIENTATION=-